MENVQIGQLARSMAGRDNGAFYLIYDVLDEAFVRVVNGDKKHLSNPKRKNIKHLELFQSVANGLAEKLVRGETVTEADVVRSIRELRDGHTEV